MDNSDRAVKLVVEAKQTHAFIAKVHNTVLLLWLLFGVFHYHSAFEERWHGLCLGVLQASSVLQSAWGVILILLVALRNDFPLNVLAVCIAFFYFGLVCGAHMVQQQ